MRITSWCILCIFNIQINEACEKVLSLSIHEPLMKILSGLEYVLRKAQVSKVLLTLELLLLFMGVKSNGVHVHVASIDSYPLYM